jgi:hypothetical protein
MADRMIAYCGLDCSACEAYLATQADSDEQLAAVAAKWSKMFGESMEPAHIVCDGCRATTRRSFYCENLCEIRKCCVGRRYESCIECADFSCDKVEVIVGHNPQARENLEGLRR